MAASCGMHTCHIWVLRFWMFFSNSLVYTVTTEAIHTFQPHEIQTALDGACLIAFAERVPTVETEFGPDVDSTAAGSSAPRSLIARLAAIYEEDPHVIIGTIDLDHFVWPSGFKLKIKQPHGNNVFLDKIELPKLIAFPRQVIDRTCLLRPAHYINDPVAEAYSGPLAVGIVVEYINSYCNAYRTPLGRVSHLGLMRKDILEHLFHVGSISDVTMQHIYTSKDVENKFNQSYTWDSNEDDFFRSIIRDSKWLYSCKASANPNKIENNYVNLKSNMKKEKQDLKISECERFSSLPSKDEFLHSYLKRSRPFILVNVTKTWPAYQKWTNSFFRERFGTNRVHIKLTPKGDFEGVENIKLWNNYKHLKIPDEVKKHLKYSDLVVVRPAGVNMNLSEFLDIIERTSHESGSEKHMSAYLEYSSLADSLPGTETDINEPEFVLKLLKRRHLNIWLSDGNTLGRLHFDPFDNMLCQMSGRKQVILFEPHNNRNMYEGHIQQATLSYDRHTKRFYRYNLEDSTSMVMSPVDLLYPDFKRFPRFAGMHPLNCTLNEGDILYMPAFWWHEVQSFPSPKQHRNLAINFWYEPFLTREFPCPECTLDINPLYHHLLL